MTWCLRIDACASIDRRSMRRNTWISSNGKKQGKEENDCCRTLCCVHSHAHFYRYMWRSIWESAILAPKRPPGRGIRARGTGAGALLRFPTLTLLSLLIPTSQSTSRVGEFQTPVRSPPSGYIISDRRTLIGETNFSVSSSSSLSLTPSLSLSMSLSFSRFPFFCSFFLSLLKSLDYLCMCFLSGHLQRNLRQGNLFLSALFFSSRLTATL